MSDPLPDNLQKLNNTPNKSTGKRKIKRYFKLILILLLFGFSIISVLYWLNGNNPDKETSTEGVEKTNNIIEMIDNVSNKFNENGEAEGNRATPEGIVESTPESRLNSEEGIPLIEINEEGESGKSVYMTGPNIFRNSDSTEFQYMVNILDSELNKFADGIQYKIERQDCKYEDFILSGSSFENTLFKEIDGNFEFKIIIDNSFIENSNELVQSTYEIDDVDGGVITRGKIQSPNCIEPNDQNSYGSINIPSPEVSTELLQGMHHFDYIFEYDDKAKEELEKGFTYEIFAAKCIGEGLDEDDYFFEGSFPEGEMHLIGFSVNIKSSALPEDENDMYTLSTYKINSLSGKELFSGFVDIPNCR